MSELDQEIVRLWHEYDQATKDMVAALEHMQECQKRTDEARKSWEEARSRERDASAALLNTNWLILSRTS